jgi:hypothetical protein
MQDAYLPPSNVLVYFRPVIHHPTCLCRNYLEDIFKRWKLLFLLLLFTLSLLTFSGWLCLVVCWTWRITRFQLTAVILLVWRCEGLSALYIPFLLSIPHKRTSAGLDLETFGSSISLRSWELMFLTAVESNMDLIMMGTFLINQIILYHLLPVTPMASTVVCLWAEQCSW